MSQWLAVDGGQSGLRLKVLPSGRTGHGPGFRYRGEDVTSAVVPAIEQAAAQAGVSGPVDVLCAGLSGLPVDPDQVRTLADALCRRLDIREVRLTTDVVTAHAGALSGRAGVVLAAGTGVVCLGLDSAGDSHRTDGAGHLFGDAGSAFDIGRRALTAVQRHQDGRGEPTDLVRAAEERYGVRSPWLPQRLYRSETMVAEVAAFAPAVVSCGRSGDRVASAILRTAGEELARTAAAALTGLEFGDGPVPLARVGKVWNAGSVLTEPFEQELARREPRLTVLPPAGDSLDGAARLATSDAGRYRTLLSVHTAESAGSARLERSSREVAVHESTGPAVPFGPGSLLVSCQAQPDSPLFGPEPMAAMARSAVAGGAAGIRVNGEADIAAVRSVLDEPVIGLLKQGERSGVYITPTIAAAEAVVRAGAHIVAMDGTPRIRLDGATLATQIDAVHRLGALVMADVDSLSAGLRARDAGADLVATSLAGYTGEEPTPDEPDLELLVALAEALDCPVIAEGRYRTAGDMRAALEHGAYAVVIGTAITNPTAITRRILQG